MYRILLIVILSLTSLKRCLTLSNGSRSLLRAIDDNAEVPDAAVELNFTNFNAALGETPATFAIVEFFAHWCPACRNYKPHYEKVARLFNGADAVHPGILLMTRVDCALKINTKLCNKFSVVHYPMLFWGPPAKFVSGSWDPNQDKSGIVLINDCRTADRLLSWINKQMQSSYGFDDGKFENEHLTSNASDPEQIVRAIYDVEEATSTALEIIFQHKMIKSGTRGSLIKFLQILVAHHPSRRCRKGSAEILVNFDDVYPLDILSDDKQETVGHGKAELGKIQICGKEVPRGYWMFCRGSKSETRGFSCGLWVLLHSLSVRVDDGESQFAFTAICEFIHSFFICEECRQHFYQMCSSVSSPFNTTRDFSLWLWTAHNEVNIRLMQEETIETADPKFPKIIWPQKQLCASCSISRSGKNNDTSRIEWNKDEVFKFLKDYYGKKIVTLYKDKPILVNGGAYSTNADDLVASTNAIVVPLGAALAIAVASCAFGALAYFWRNQQKNRKYFHNLHSLKNI